MEVYKNLNGDSNVTHYSIGDDYIIVVFRSGKFTRYTYNYDIPGRDDVERMKALAIAGRGLNSIISTHIKKRYAHKE